MQTGTKLVAILNLTPDSFSDGGVYVRPEAALARVEQLLADGADIIDIGAESTRPGAESLSPEEEWARLEPVLVPLEKRKIPVSVDTRHAPVAAQALRLGVRWINDVSGFRDPAMVEAVKDRDCKLVVMHALSVPVDPKETIPADTDAVEEVADWMRAQVARLEQQGISKERLILDPGIGFGKTAEQSYALIQQVKKLQALQLPLLYGHSRKSFLKLFTDKPASERDEETLTLSRQLAQQGVDYLRVHDVAGHKRMLKELHG